MSVVAELVEKIEKLTLLEAVELKKSSRRKIWSNSRRTNDDGKVPQHQPLQ